VAGLSKLRANRVARGERPGQLKVIVQRHYVEAMVETTTAMEEAELLGQCVSRGSLDTRKRLSKPLSAAPPRFKEPRLPVRCSIHTYTIRGNFLQENFFRIFLSPCGAVVCDAK
jgi:hypothetical protein